MVGKALPAVVTKDHAAAAKAVFFQQVLHDAVILMGVYPQLRALCPAKVQTPGGEAGQRAVACDTVDGGIGRVVEPAAPDHAVGGVVPGIQANTPWMAPSVSSA